MTFYNGIIPMNGVVIVSLVIASHFEIYSLGADKMYYANFRKFRVGK